MFPKCMCVPSTHVVAALQGGDAGRTGQTCNLGVCTRWYNIDPLVFPICCHTTDAGGHMKIARSELSPDRQLRQCSRPACAFPGRFLIVSADVFAR